MGDSLFKIDGRYRSSILVDPPDGRMPALTEAGQARRSAGPSPRGPQPQDQNQIEPPDDLLKNDGTAWWLDEGSHPYDGPETLTLLDRCLLYADATIPMIPTMYNNMKTVVQTDTHLLINIEWMHWARIVRIDAEHLDPEIRSLAGDSIGWWEGDTLVVETTTSSRRPAFPGTGCASSNDSRRSTGTRCSTGSPCTTRTTPHRTAASCRGRNPTSRVTSTRGTCRHRRRT